MTCFYRRKRITGVPAAATRELDDELAGVERALDCLRRESLTQVANLSVIDVTATSLTVASDTGSDATLPAATAALAGVATGAQVTKLDGIQAGAVAAGAAGDAFSTSHLTAYSHGLIATAVQPARSIAASNGLQGGGDLSADRTLSPVYGTTAGTVCQGNDSRLAAAGGGANFRGSWAAGTSYAVDDMILDGPWLAIAIAATTERPAPTETAAKIWVLDPEPPWTGTNTLKLFGTRYGPSLSNDLLCGVRVRTNVAGSINYVYIKMQSGTRIDLSESVAATGAWQEFRFLPIPIPPNQYFDVVVQADSWVSSANFYAANSKLKSFVDTYPASVFNENAYGVDVLLQNDYASPAWSLIAKSIVA